MQAFLVPFQQKQVIRLRFRSRRRKNPGSAGFHTPAGYVSSWSSAKKTASFARLSDAPASSEPEVRGHFFQAHPFAVPLAQFQPYRGLPYRR
jgi:hypothetical protein